MSESFEKMLAKHCAPTLCSVKSANLISCNKKKFPNALDYVKEINSSKNIKCEILREENDNYLLLIYNEKLLNERLSIEANINFLRNNGYPNNDINNNLKLLKNKLIQSKDFPHEIGIFLDYPLEDVLGFVNKEKCLYIGYWRVYNNLNEKKMLFKKYNECTNYVLNSLDNGKKLNYFLGGN